MKEICSGHDNSRMRSEVKVNRVTATHRHPKMHRHTKFWIPSSNNVRDMLQTRLSRNEVKGQGHSKPKMICDIPPSQNASTQYTMCDAYLK